MIRIITDSVSSITQEMAAQLDIQVVTLYVNRNGREYEDATMDLDAFYADIYDMVDDIPTSSQPSQHLLEEVFEDAARAGDQVCGIFISTGLSGAYDGALRAIRAVAARNIGLVGVDRLAVLRLRRGVPRARGRGGSRCGRGPARRGSGGA